VLEQAEVEAILHQINTRTPTGARNYGLLQLMLQAGIRCGEALQVTADMIRLEQWQDNRGHVPVWVLRLPRKATKGQQGRQGLPLSSATRQAIERWQEHRAALHVRGGPLFCTVSRGKRRAGFSKSAVLRPGKPLNSRYVRELVARLAKKAGISRRVHPHMLRHTAITDLYDRTHDLRMTQQVAGHSSSRMTERYTHVRPVDVARAMGAIVEEEAPS
jgi:site-specific recombinase XerD